MQNQTQNLNINKQMELIIEEQNKKPYKKYNHSKNLSKKIKKRKRSLRQLKQRRLNKLLHTKQLHLLAPGQMINKFPQYQFGNYRRAKLITIEEDIRISSIPKQHINNKKVLDIGCGDGNLTIQITKLYEPLEMTGIDLSKPLVRYANKCKQVSLNTDVHTFQSFNSLNSLKYLQHNFFTAEIKQQSYHSVICFDVLQYIGLTFGSKIVEQFIHKVYLILVQGGVLILRYKQMIQSTDFYGVVKNAGLGFQSIENMLNAAKFKIDKPKYESLSKIFTLICTKI